MERCMACDSIHRKKKNSGDASIFIHYDTMHGLSMYWKWKIEMDIVCTGNGNSMYFVLFESFEG
jgi:hypothetical protein